MKAKIPGELEMQILDILWQYGNCTISDIFKKLKIKRKIAYTTIATVLQRLYNKGQVDREKRANHYIYISHFNKKIYSLRLIKNFLNGLMNNFGDVAIASFAESLDSLPKKKKDHLLKLLNEKK